jgi:hypothetical protein
MAKNKKTNIANTEAVGDQPPGGIVPLANQQALQGPPGGVVPLGRSVATNSFPKSARLYAPNVGRAVVAAAGSDELLDLSKIRGAIALLDASNAVHWDQGKGQFSFDVSAVALLPPGYQQLFSVSAARASLEPLAQNAGGIGVAAAAAPDDTKFVQALDALDAGADLIAHFKALFAGVTAHAYWWGIQLDLTKPGADALVQILKVDFKYLSALIPIFPHAALILTVAMAGGSALGTWVKASNKGNAGVSVFLYLWVVPAVQAR